MPQPETFELTPELIRLLRASVVAPQITGDEHGAAAIDPKRPYGNSNVMGDIAYTMKSNPSMRVLLMGGYFDLGTLYFGAEYEMKHLPIPQELQKNIEYKFFPTGHMVYVNEDALKALHDRTAQFIHENAGTH